MERLREFGTRRVSLGSRAMKIEKWKSIESLNGIRLEDLAEMSSGLMPNSHLRKLQIIVNEDYGIDDDELVSRGRASLQKMPNLEKLHLKFDHKWYSKLLAKLIPNLESLTSLELNVYGGRVETPVASVFPPNLSNLTLARIEDPSMEELGKLSKLQYLTLKRSVASENASRMKILHDGFPCLKALSLKDIDGLRGMDIEEGGMSCLKQLRIRDCRDLKSTENLPKHINISFA